MKNLLLITDELSHVFTIPNNLFDEFKTQRELYDKLNADFNSDSTNATSNTIITEQSQILEILIETIKNNYKSKYIDAVFRFCN